jgi:hypothetical protein
MTTGLGKISWISLSRVPEPYMHHASGLRHEALYVAGTYVISNFYAGDFCF